ncbi:hypothetical protein INT43_005288 [Umbelopsis isabellina]|uniref:Uncharacterized protein n=1 Tax=Mortierella isabellina TaxID=91625 RepID=A0A8H7PH68_MORIS|nr:hypothetical protein INT43_005288 [Umbelopsis isabellina]
MCATYLINSWHVSMATGTAYTCALVCENFVEHTPWSYGTLPLEANQQLYTTGIKTQTVKRKAGKSVFVNDRADVWRTENIETPYMIETVAAQLAENMQEPKDADPKRQYKYLSPARVHHSTNENDFEQDEVEHVVVQMLSVNKQEKQQKHYW